MSRPREDREFRFTQKKLAQLPSPDAGRVTYRDTVTPRLTLSVSATGAMSFYRYGRASGRPTRILLGKWPDMTVEGARKACEKINGAIAAGEDPSAKKRAARGELTFGEVFTRYLNEHAKPHKRTWAEDQRIYEHDLKAKWAHRKLSEIGRDDVAKVHLAKGLKASYQANRILALVSKVLSFARVQLGWPGENVAQGVKKFPERSRRRFMDGRELKAFFKALEAEEDDDARHFYMLALLTGARRGNLEAMQWQDVDLSRAVWSVPADESKNAEDLEIVLPRAAVEILEERIEERADTEYVFASARNKTGHVTELKKRWASILERAGIEDLRVHDLRRTLGSWAAARNTSLHVIGKALGHKSLEATRVYSRLNLDPVREAVDGAVDAMLAASADKEADDDEPDA